MGPLRGEYGFLTQFSNLTEVEARERARMMVAKFGIMEFQFYNSFEGYSRPPASDQTKWHCAAMSAEVQRSIIWAYTDEITRLGGRSWLYVQTMGTNPGDVEWQDGVAVSGQYNANGLALLDIVVPDAKWAARIAPAWADFAASLGFSGIHWDTLGKGNLAPGFTCDLPGFLRSALPLLREKGLAQTCNFVDGFGWDKSLLESAGGNQNVIAFPYWDAGPVPEEEEHFFDFLSYWDAGAVLVEFPGRMQDTIGIWSLDVVIARWQKVRCHSGSYLCIGDGDRRIHSDYLPDAVKMNESEIKQIRAFLFAENTCPDGSHTKPGAGKFQNPGQTTTKNTTNPHACIHSTAPRTGKFLLSAVPLTNGGTDAAATVDAHKLTIARVIADTLGFCSVRILDVECQGACSASSSVDSGGKVAVELAMPLEAKGMRAANPTAGQLPSLHAALQDAFDKEGVRLTVKGAVVSLEHPPNERVPARFSLWLAALFCAATVPLGLNSLSRGRRAREAETVQLTNH